MEERLRFEREVRLLARAGGAVTGPIAIAPKMAPKVRSKACADSLKATRVAVVGGGLAGLMAALELGQQGAKVTLYEARTKVGGRVSSSKDFAAGRITEEGAELIGSFHTTLLELALKYRISMITRASDDAYDRQGLKLKLELRGRELSNEDYFLVSEEMEDVLESIAKHADIWIKDAEEPWTSSRLLKNRQTPPLTLDDLDKLSVAKALQDLYRVQQNTYLWDMLIHLLVNDEVAPLEQMNFLGLLCKVKGGQGRRLGRPFRQKPPKERDRDEHQRIMGYWHELEIFRCADGCEALAKEMKSEIEKRYRAKLLLRTAVTNIHLTDGGVLIGSRAVRDGKVSEDPPVPAFYDYVVFTIPPTVWSKVSVTAGGTLNKEKTKVVGGKSTNLAADSAYVMNSGDCIKHFTTAPDRFWLQHPPAAPYGGTLKLGQVWEGTDNQTGIGSRQAAVLSVFAGPLVPDPLKPGGKGLRVPSEKECVSELRRLYGKRYPAKTNTKNTRYANWPQTPFIMTGYASPSLGQVLKVGHNLSIPHHKRLIFAGEHANMGFFGYMEGALRSGVRAAALLESVICNSAKQSPDTQPDRIRVA